jgi:hypothetical protein
MRDAGKTLPNQFHYSANSGNEVSQTPTEKMAEEKKWS